MLTNMELVIQADFKMEGDGTLPSGHPSEEPASGIWETGASLGSLLST